MRSFFLFGLMVLVTLISQPVKAQFITIPDSNFANLLNSWPVSSGCMNGDQLDTLCAAGITDTAFTMISNNDVLDITGIGYFKKFRLLQLQHTWIQKFPPLPDSLKTIYVLYTGTEFDTIENLPDGLRYLYFDYGSVSHIDHLPASLIELKMDHQQFTSLPALPSGLTSLSCSWNPLTSLPVLPQSLLVLKCSVDSLSGTFPPLPPALEELEFSINQITAVTSFPNTLKKIYCDRNPLSSLPVLPDSLEEFWAYECELDSLPPLPDKLKSTYLYQNNLTSLSNWPAALEFMYISSNQLTSLPAGLPPSSLHYLNVNNNQLTSIPDLSHCQDMFTLYCTNNNLTHLPSVPDSMRALQCNNNPAVMCLPLIKYVGNNPNNLNSPQLTFYNTGITCLSGVVSHSGTWPNVDTLPICDVFNSNGCNIGWNILGQIHLDYDADCNAGPSDPPIQNIKIELLQNGVIQQQVFSNPINGFSFDTNLGNYETRVDTTGLPLIVTCPAGNSYISDLTATDSLDYNADFGLQCKPGYDVAVQSIHQSGGVFFPDIPAKVSIHAGDFSSYFSYVTACNPQSLNGNVAATFTGPASIASVSANGLVAGNTVTWNVADFSQVNFFNDFKITFLTDSFAQADDKICLTVTVTANTGTDNNLSNNTLTQCFNVVNSYDPNVKEVYPSTVSQAGDFHTYTVHFQNTGTAPAQHIQIIDTLDQNLDWSSFQLLAYSHNNLTQVKPNGIVHFNFPNIQLPDSSSNEPASHGYIQYKIRTKTDITPGTTIHNTASIYFDFNTPVVTNDAVVNYCVPAETSQSFSICQGDSVNVGTSWYHQAGVYTNTLATSGGCDSVVTTTLAVNPIESYVENYTLCPGDSVTANGVVYHQPVSFTDTTIGSQGCPVYLLTNIIAADVDTAVSLSGNTLTAAPALFAYQWIDCATGLPVAGETTHTFTPQQSGHYAVKVTSNEGCIEMSACYNVIITGIAQAQNTPYRIYPNPAGDAVTLTHPTNTQNGLVAVVDLTGRVVFTRALSEQSSTILDLQNISSGAYYLEITVNGKTTSVQKLAVMR